MRLVDNPSLLARITALAGKQNLSPQNRLLRLAIKGEAAPTLLSPADVSDVCRELVMHYHQMGIK